MSECRHCKRQIRIDIDNKEVWSDGEEHTQDACIDRMKADRDDIDRRIAERTTWCVRCQSSVHTTSCPKRGPPGAIDAIRHRMTLDERWADTPVGARLAFWPGSDG